MDDAEFEPLDESDLQSDIDEFLDALDFDDE